MYILEEFTDTWNYTFIIVAIAAIIFGTVVTLKVNSKENMEKRRQKDENLKKYNDANVEEEERIV